MSRPNPPDSWLREHFGADFRHIRGSRGVGSRQAAREARIHFVTLTRIERGEVSTSIENVAAMANWADLDLDAYRRTDSPAEED